MANALLMCWLLWNAEAPAQWHAAKPWRPCRPLSGRSLVLRSGNSCFMTNTPRRYAGPATILRLQMQRPMCCGAIVLSTAVNFMLASGFFKTRNGLDPHIKKVLILHNSRFLEFQFMPCCTINITSVTSNAGHGQKHFCSVFASHSRSTSTIQADNASNKGTESNNTSQPHSRLAASSHLHCMSRRTFSRQLQSVLSPEGRTQQEG